jgi:hypothetical protein
MRRIASLASLILLLWTSLALARLALQAQTGSTQRFPIIPQVGGAAARGADDGISVRDYGAKGDGVTDDTAAIQAAADALRSGGELIFPAGIYRISDTIHLGRWSIRGNNDVLGFSGTRHGIVIIGGGDPKHFTAKVVWGGLPQAGDSSATYEDNVGAYTIITNARPMFSLVACSGVTIENMVFDGDGKAFVGVQFDGGFEGIRVSQCVFTGCYIGCRNTIAWDYVGARSYLGYASSPYLRTLIDIPALGGFMSDSHVYTACHFRNCTIGYSSESAQALGITFQACGWFSNSHANVGVVGSRLSFYGCFHSGTPAYDVLNPAGNCILTFVEHHAESTPSVAGFSSVYAVPSAGPELAFINSEFNSIKIYCGGAKISALNSDLGAISRVLDYDQEFYCSLLGTQVDTINLTTSSHGDKIHVGGMNVKVTGPLLLSGTGAYECRHVFLNVYPPSAYPADVASKGSPTQDGFDRFGRVLNKSANFASADGYGLYILDTSREAINPTLADGTSVGQRVRFVVKTGGHDFDLTVTHYTASQPAVIRLDAAREWAELVWDGTGWVEIGGSGQSYPETDGGVSIHSDRPKE